MKQEQREFAKSKDILRGKLSYRSIVAITGLIREAMQDRSDAEFLLRRARRELDGFQPEI